MLLMLLIDSNFNFIKNMKRLLHLSSFFISNTAKNQKYIFKYGWSILPHPQKQAKGGEDAVYASKQILIVADGVGGWAQSGIDPGLYSKRLVKIMEELIEKDPSKYIKNPKELVNEAVQMNKETGSTTVGILTLEPDTGVLRSYYLGDSVYAIVNEKESKIEVAPDQQIEFNFPVQVGTNGFSPLDGLYKEQKVEQIPEGSYFVLATDGLWDNMDLNSIYAISCNKVEGMQLETLDKRAEVMALATRFLYCQQEEYESPFYLKAKSQGINYPKQGKPDDVSIIIAQIIKEQL